MSPVSGNQAYGFNEEIHLNKDPLLQKFGGI